MLLKTVDMHNQHQVCTEKCRVYWFTKRWINQTFKQLAKYFKTDYQQ